MHRILGENAQSKERRDQLRRPRYTAPQLLATRPNELWSWDITKLLGPQKWTYYYLYVLLDVFSRYVVGWLLADRECGGLATRLVGESCERQGIGRDELTVHSDRGGPMRSKVLAQLYADLGVTKTHSRPHVSNDNPFSESQFKTLKYRPGFPDRFGSHEDARSCASDLLGWYNHEHNHSSLAYLTPYEVHYGLADQRLAESARWCSRRPSSAIRSASCAVRRRCRCWLVPCGSTRPRMGASLFLATTRTGPSVMTRPHPARHLLGARVAPQQSPILRPGALNLHMSSPASSASGSISAATRRRIRLVSKAANLGVWGRAPTKKSARRLRRSAKP